MDHRKWTLDYPAWQQAKQEHNDLYNDWKKASLESERLAKINGDMCDTIARLERELEAVKAERDHKDNGWNHAIREWERCQGEVNKLRANVLAGVQADKEQLVSALIEAKRQRDVLASKLISRGVNARDLYTGGDSKPFGGWHFEDGYKIVPNSEPSKNTGELPTPTPEQVEALAEVLDDAYGKATNTKPCWPLVMEERRAARLLQARAAFAHIQQPVGVDPDAWKTPLFLDACGDDDGDKFIAIKNGFLLTHIGDNNWEYSPDDAARLALWLASFAAAHGCPVGLRSDEYTAAESARIARSDAEDLRKALGKAREEIDFLKRNSAERPKGLPSAPDLIAQVGTDLNIPHDEKFSPYSNRGWEYTRAILAALAPWLRDPVGWELDVTTSEAEEAYENARGHRTRNMDAVLDLCRSRIRPVMECKECARKIAPSPAFTLPSVDEFRVKVGENSGGGLNWTLICMIADTLHKWLSRAALEGE